ncbi:conjugal transfer protein TraG N-terminal domain-containing protein [Castellaniella ginsengisoli]|uniref:Conjugal transfer protein TraG N-terminal domain-containing protein n=1 Tax=Castellaniella ginsengisoli TaxID=546114 RepID=A0AB39CG46_9BURK
MPTFTIYVTSGADWFYATLNAVAMIFSDSDLIWSVALMGAMFAIITGAWHFIQKNVGSGQIRTHTWVEHGLMMAIAVALGFAPTRCIVQDIYGDQTATAVDNVPLIVSAPAAIFSGISYEVFKAMDTALQSAAGSYMSVSDQGFATPLKLLFAMRGGLEKSAPDLARSFQNYLLDCSKNSTINSRALATTPDLFRYLIENGRDTGLVETYIAPGPGGTTQSLSTAAVVSCSQAKALLQQRFDVFESGAGAGQSDIERLINYNIQTAQKGGGGVNRYTYTDFENSFNQLLGFTGQSAQQYMRTALVRNLVNDTYRCANAAYDNAAFVNCTQIQNDAMEAYKIDSTGAASLFTKTMFPAMTLLQMMFFAFSVVIFLYGLLRGAGVLAYLGKYLLFGAWVFSWLPFVAVINAFIQWMVEEKIRQLPVAGLTSESYSTYMYDVLSTNLATASDMLAATPLLTLGLLTGSAFALAGWAGRLSARDYVDESQAAPRTGTVQPLVQTTAQHTSNVATGVQSADFETPRFSVSDSLRHVEESAHAQSLGAQVAQMRSAEQYVGSAVQEVGGGSWTSSDGRTHSLQRMDSLQESERVAMQVAESKNYGADVRAELTAGFKALGAGTSAAEVYRKMESAEAREAFSQGIDAGTQYADNYVSQAQDLYAARGGTLSEDVRRAGDSYQDQRQKAIQDRSEWKAVSARAQDTTWNRSLSAPVFGQALEEDAAMGTDGHSWARRINERYRDLAAEKSDTQVNAVYRQQLAYLTRNGKTQLPGQEEMAQWLTIQRYDTDYASRILGEVVAAPAVSADYDRYAGIGDAARGIDVSAASLGAGVPSAVAQTGAVRGMGPAVGLQERVAITDDTDNGGAGIQQGMDSARSQHDARVAQAGGRGGLDSLDAAGKRAEGAWLTGQQKPRIQKRGEVLADNGGDESSASSIDVAHAMLQDSAQTLVTSRQAVGDAQSAAAKEFFGEDISKGRPPESYIPRAERGEDGKVQYWQRLPSEKEKE